MKSSKTSFLRNCISGWNVRNPKYKEFPSPNEFINFDFSSRVKSVNVGEVVILENNYHKFVALKVTKVVKKKEDINHLLEFDYKIYKKIENV